MKKRRSVQPDVQRPKQEVSADIVADLVDAVRRTFYPEYASDARVKKQFCQDLSFLKTRVILWPASWLNGKGVSLKPERYKEILLTIFNEARIHGTTAPIRYFPAYLAQCVQSHFRINEDSIYAEAKSLRTMLENVIGAAKQSQAAEANFARTLAEARQAIIQGRRLRKEATLPPPKANTGQLDLF